MKVFISSVRQGLEEERDALPAMIKAIGHIPVRFEDYTARPLPSRDACIEGVEDADAYLLLLGPKYGAVLPDTQLSPTEEEWTVAKRRGIPILVFRKLGVDESEGQRRFVQRVEDYVQGRFRDTFSGVADLLPKVAELLREVDQAAAPLVWAPLPEVVDTEWIVAEERGWLTGRVTTLEVHLHPLGLPGRVSALGLVDAGAQLARAGRDHGLFDVGDGLEIATDGTATSATRSAVRGRAAGAGVRLAASGVASSWAELPHDSMGSIIDRTEIAAAIARMVRLAAEVAPESQRVSFSVGLGPTGMSSEADVRDLGRRTSATMDASDRLIRVPAEESLDASSAAASTDEVAAELAMRLLQRYRSP